MHVFLNLQSSLFLIHLSLLYLRSVANLDMQGINFKSRTDLLRYTDTSDKEFQLKLVTHSIAVR